MNAIMNGPELSNALKGTLDRSYTPTQPSLPRRPIDPPPPQIEPPVEKPVYRRLRAYAFDPSLSSSFETAQFNQITVEIPWEDLKAGPTGEYVEVIDHDPASGCFYPAVELDNKHLLASDGLPPSPGNPQFHQQMVYAVTMQTIRNFELALGRRVQWSPDMRNKDNPREDSKFVRRLRIYPHALREENACYLPSKKALLFGYFAARPSDPSEIYSGGTTFACLSHDIVAHETTHAILDGIYRDYMFPTNLDQLAFHEAFADVVALLQHFSVNSVVESQIRKYRGELVPGNALFDIGSEFGRATGMQTALRTALGGGTDPRTGCPDYYALGQTRECHKRGAILVNAIFDAFVAIYRARTADLTRIATGGTGRLPEGEIHPDLVKRCAREASAVASQFLNMCIRALDYCPPVDLTFGDYLRALITADHDLVPNDPLGYRVAISESFRRHAIFPANLGTFGEDTLLWQATDTDATAKLFKTVGDKLDRLANQMPRIDGGPAQRLIPENGARKRLFDAVRETRAAVHQKLATHIVSLEPEQRKALGHDLGLDLGGDNPKFELHTLAIAERQGPEGRGIDQFVVTFVQDHKIEDGAAWSGATVLLNRGDRKVRYIIRKRPTPTRLEQSRSFALRLLADENPYFRVSPDQRFAFMHATGGIPND